MAPVSDDIRGRRAAIDTLTPAERPAALAALADAVEDEGLPGVAKSLRLLAINQARDILGPDAPLIADLQDRLARPRTSDRPCPLDRPAQPDRETWRTRIRALSDKWDKARRQ